MLGTFGDPFDVRDPTMLQLLAYHSADGVEPILDAIDEEVAAVAAGGATEEEVGRVVTTMTAQTIRRLDDIMNRALAAACLEQQRGRAELLGELFGLLGRGHARRHRPGGGPVDEAEQPGRARGRARR